MLGADALLLWSCSLCRKIIQGAVLLHFYLLVTIFSL